MYAAGADEVVIGNETQLSTSEVKSVHPKNRLTTVFGGCTGYVIILFYHFNILTSVCMV